MKSGNKSFSSQPQQNPEKQPLFNHLEHIYNQDAQQNKSQAKLHKHLYYKIVQQNQRKKNERKSLEKHINSHQNQQIDIFWKNRQHQLRERERKNKEMIDDARNLNNKMLQQKVNYNNLQKSITIPLYNQFQHNAYIEDMKRYESKYKDQKQFQKHFLDEGQSYNDYKHYQSQLESQRAAQTQRKKLKQSQQIQRKRLEQLDKWRKKYLQSHNKQAYQIWDKARRNRVNQEDALDNYIVFQGARQLNERTSQMKNEYHQRQLQKKHHFINDLQSQLQSNEYRTANDSKLERQYERKIINERNQFLMAKDRIVKDYEEHQHKQHLEFLKSQIKPRSILPEKEKLQFPGIGSPVHIGKVIGQDRRKQLQILQKSLYKELAL